MVKIVFGPWRKSKHSGNEGNCVEIAWADRSVGLRNSKNPGGPILVVSRDAFRRFANVAASHK